MWQVAAAMAGAQILGGLMANDAQRGAIRSQKKMYEELNRQLAAIGEPQLDPQQFQQIHDKMSQLSPDELFKVAQVGPSAMETMQIDRTGRGAQLQALARLQQEGGQGGMTVEDRLAIEQARAEAESQDAARQAALQESFQRRGVAGGGQEFAARLASQQNAGNQGRLAGLQTAAAARQRALQSIMGAGQLGQGLQSADTEESMAKARAADQIAQFNAGLLQQGYNQRGQAGMDIARNAQDVAARNTGIANQQMQYNQDLLQRAYQNKLDKLRIKQGVTGAQAGAAAQQGQNQANMYTGVGNAAASGLNAYMNWSKPNTTTLNINNTSTPSSEFDPEKFGVAPVWEPTK